MIAKNGVYAEDFVKFLHIADPHLNSSTPCSRVDDYAETSVEKLHTLIDLMVERGLKALVMSGDVFHKNQQSLIYLSKVFEAFVRMRNSGIRVYTNFGNHDLAFDKVENIDKSPLWLLIQAGLIIPIGRLVLPNGVEIVGVHYPDEVEKAEKDNMICVCHRFFESSLHSKTYSEGELINLGYRMYLMGHDHVPYEDYILENGARIIRPGSFMRTTAHGYNLSREVYAYEINTDDMSVERISLKVKPAESVFSSAVLNTDGLSMRKASEEMQEQIGALLDKMDSSGVSGGSVYEFLDAMPLEKRVKERIEAYLIQNNIYRKVG